MNDASRPDLCSNCVARPRMRRRRWCRECVNLHRRTHDPRVADRRASVKQYTDKAYIGDQASYMPVKKD